MSTILAGGVEHPTSLLIHRDTPFASLIEEPPDKLVFHQSVTHDIDVADDDGEGDDATEKILRKRKLGVHFMLGMTPRGLDETTQHNDTHHRLAHAGVLNTRSIAIEEINPYYPPLRAPWQTLIKAPWAHKGQTILPTISQCYAAFRLTRQLCEIHGIPAKFHGVHPTKGFYLGPLAKTYDWSQPGIYAHGQYPAHSDGLFMVAFLYLCFHHVDSVDPLRVFMAYQRAEACAKAGRWVKW